MRRPVAQLHRAVVSREVGSWSLPWASQVGKFLNVFDLADSGQHTLINYTYF